MNAPLNTLTVSELTAAIKSLLEPPFRAVSVKGEISNFKLQTSGHLYFSLKDAGSQISAVLFRANAARLAQMPKEGDQVVASGEISLYAPRGQYQIVIRELQFLGIGELLLKLHELKERLQKLCWFDPARKKPVPKLPRRIGVVTSPTGAVIQDILNVLTRRFATFHVILNPVKVQGDGAAQEIAKAIEDFNKHSLADVLIVGRGGGSIEDLWAFNEEVVAKAIFESRIPIISAVGHETDFTIADWVADIRAPTPSAAAEIAIAEKSNLLKALNNAERMCKQRIDAQVRQGREKIRALRRHPLFSSPYKLLSQPIQQLDALRASLELLKPSNRIALWRSRLSPFPEKVASTMHAMLQERRKTLLRIWEHLSSLNPRNLLKKGYTILLAEKEPGKKAVVFSAKEFKPNQPFTALAYDGQIHAVATQVIPNDAGRDALF